MKCTYCKRRETKGRLMCVQCRYSTKPEVRARKRKLARERIKTHGYKLKECEICLVSKRVSAFSEGFKTCIKCNNERTKDDIDKDNVYLDKEVLRKLCNKSIIFPDVGVVMLGNKPFPFK